MNTLVLLLLCLCFPLVAGDEETPKPKNGLIGDEACMDCHDDDVEVALTLSHFAAMKDDHSCENCHGPGLVHEDDPDVNNILGADQSRQISENCKSCHEGAFQGSAFRRPEHHDGGVACLECHGSGHTPTPDTPLLAHKGERLCASCHQDVAVAFALPHTHREGNKPMSCMTCHNTHGNNSLEGFLTKPGQDVCVDCHTAQAGPFIFAHPSREPCSSCHQVHGSPNPSMLNRVDSSRLCMECHADTPTFHDITQSRFQVCVDCHTAVHGSFRDHSLLEE